MNSQPVSSDTATKGHIPALDGMRGLAILLVLIEHISIRFHCHSGLTTAITNIGYGGWIGVDLFFVLSGFLITGILWDSRNNAHYFRNFYARRTIRIFPLYYASLILFMVIAPDVLAFTACVPARLQGSTRDLILGVSQARDFWPLFCGYLVNVLVAWKGFGIWLTHFWSLSVEEHFYLIWPFLVYRLKRRTLIITSAVLIGTAFLIRAIAIWLINTNAIYVLTPFRMDGLAMGALLVLLWRTPEHRSRLGFWARAILPTTGLLLVALFCYKGKVSPFSHVSQTFGYSSSILFFGSLLVMVLEVQWLNWIFRHQFLRFFGKYSYSIYIFHLLPLVILDPVFALGNPSHPSIVVDALRYFSGGPTLPISRDFLWVDGLAYVLLVPAASAGIAMITWRVLEAPCLRLKHFFSYEEKGIPVEGADLVANRARSWFSRASSLGPQRPSGRPRA